MNDMVGMREIFGRNRAVIGMVHLPPLPGSYRNKDDIGEIIKKAAEDALLLEKCGVHGVLVENYNDAPYSKRVEPVTTACMALCVKKVLEAVKIPVGVNVLRNDAAAALSIAHACGADFIRVNVFSGVAFTDQGIIEGEANSLLALKKRLNSRVRIFSDVHVKHAFHPAGLEQDVVNAERNLADAIIISGKYTGGEAEPDAVLTAKALTSLPVIVGSGITPANLDKFREADGFIVGSYFKKGMRISGEKVKKLVRAFLALR